MTAKRWFRIQPSEKAGYGPGQFVVQYHDRDAKVWFDIGDPLTEQEAKERLEKLTDGTYDLPEGYRWATEEECYELEGMQVFPDDVEVVPRSFSCNGHRYTQGEADLAVREGT